MKRPYQITGTLFFLFSAFIGWESWTGLKFYTSLGPGPGFFPFWLSVIMAVLSGMMVFHATFHEPDPMPEDFFASRAGYLKAAAVCVALVWANQMMERIGFRFTMIVFFIFLLISLGRVNPLITLAVTLVASIGSFWLFVSVLKVPLPVGPFDGIFATVGEWLEPLLSIFGR